MFGTGWTVRGMLLQVTFFPGRHSISKAAVLFHCHVWLMPQFCSLSPPLRPQWLHTQLIQTHTHINTEGDTHTSCSTGQFASSLPSTQWPPFYCTADILSLTHTPMHTLTDLWQLIPLVPPQNLVRWWKQLQRWAQSRLKSDQDSLESQLRYYDSMETS